MWELSFLPEAREDLRALDGSQRIRVEKAIAKVQSNPLPSSEGGYGNPLGNKRERIEHAMRIVVIGVRSDDAVYREAQKRRESHGL